MTLTNDEKERIKEEETYRKSVRSETGKVPWWKPKGFGAWVVIIFVVLGLIGSAISRASVNSPVNSLNTTLSTIPTRTPEAQKAWDSSKAGQICKTNPAWTEEDCNSLAENKIWIGMSYDMLVYLSGKPDASNPSNYGGKTRWQWCWNDLNPDCFYDNNDDGIIDSYN